MNHNKFVLRIDATKGDSDKIVNCREKLRERETGSEHRYSKIVKICVSAEET